MAAVITQKWKQYIASLFKTSLSDPTSNLYLFIGKPLPWEISEELPPFPLDTIDNQRRVWDDILALKKIRDVDATYAIPRRNWDESGNSVYFPYDDKDSLLFKHPTDDDILTGQTAIDPYDAGSFYVITDEYHVFKCLDNAGFSKSTVKPVKPLTPPYIFQGADGYRWKYMFTVLPQEIEQFLTDAWIPLKTLLADDGSDQWLVQQDALSNNGSIYNTLVVNGGVNYFEVQDADPENPDPQVAQGGGFDSIILSAAASGIDNTYVGATIWIVGGTGVGQTAVISSYVGATKTANIVGNWGLNPDNSSQYQILPTVTITGDGIDAVGKPVVVGGIITRVDMIDIGSGYNYASAVTTGAGGISAVISPQIPPISGHGGDPVQELGGNFVLLRVKLEYDEGDGDFPIVNDYRKVGIIRNVMTPFDVLATDNTLIGVQKLELTTVTGTFLSDEPIVGSISNAIGNVVQFEDLGSATGSVSYIQDPAVDTTSFGAGEIITGGVSGATAVISSIVVAEAKKYVGELLALEHRRKITRAPDQKETIFFVLKF